MQSATPDTARILIVDDQEPNVRLLEGILLRAGYVNVTRTTDPRQAAELFAETQPDIVLLDMLMPYLDGFGVMEQLQRLTPEGSYLSVLVLTADVTAGLKRRALSMGAKDFLTKPFDHAEVLLRIKNLLETRSLHLQLQGQNRTLEAQVRERTRDLEEAQFEILERLACAAEYRDDDTGQHTQRVGHTCALIAAKLGLPKAQMELIRRASPLHDLGKIGIPDSILLKPSRLTTDEFEVMKTHTVIGARTLSNGHSDLIKMAERIALTHHERWDGSGYPHCLAGDDIPIEGRITAVADVFDALTHSRPYKAAWPVEEAVIEIARQSGKQFDPQVVEVFLAVYPSFVEAMPAALLKVVTAAPKVT